jgi:hypothetical protein
MNSAVIARLDRATVIAGLDPAIHPFRKMLLAKMDGYAGQARA